MRPVRRSASAVVGGHLQRQQQEGGRRRWLGLGDGLDRHTERGHGVPRSEQVLGRDGGRIGRLGGLEVQVPARAFVEHAHGAVGQQLGLEGAPAVPRAADHAGVHERVGAGCAPTGLEADRQAGQQLDGVGRERQQQGLDQILAVRVERSRIVRQQLEQQRVPRRQADHVDHDPSGQTGADLAKELSRLVDR